MANNTNTLDESQLIFSAGDNPNWNDVTRQTRLGTNQMWKYIKDMGLLAQITSGKRSGSGKSHHDHGNGVDIYLGDENDNRLSVDDSRVAKIINFGKENGWGESDYHDYGSGYHLHLGDYQGQGGVSPHTETQNHITPGGSMNYNSDELLNGSIKNIKDWVNNQVDPTTLPFVKDKEFFDKIANMPIENSKMAAYRQNINDLELLKIANSRLPGARENLMSVALGLMKQSSDAAEQDANIRNEMTRRQAISEALQGMQDIRNPIEALNVLKTLEATTGLKHNPAEVSAMYGNKESTNENQFKGATTLAGIFSNLYSQEQQMAIQREQMAQQERLANMRIAAGGSGSGGRGGYSLNFKDINGAWSKYNKILSDVEEASRDSFYQGNPRAFKDLIGRYGNEINSLAAQDPLRGKEMMSDWETRVSTLIPDFSGKQNINNPTENDLQYENNNVSAITNQSYANSDGLLSMIRNARHSDWDGIMDGLFKNGKPEYGLVSNFYRGYGIPTR